MPQASKLSVAALCTLFAVSATSFAQDSKPAKKPEAKSATGLLYSVFTEKDGQRSIETHCYDLGKKKAQSLLAAPGEFHVLMDVSPHQKNMALYQRSKEGGNKIVFADVKTGKVHKTQPLKGYASVVFKTDTRFYALEKVEKDPNGIKSRLIEIDIDGKNRNLIWESKVGFWDDIPLKLSPNGKYLSYFSHGDENGVKRGLVIFNLKTGKKTRFKEGITFVVWGRDSKTLGVFDKSTKSALTYTLNEKDDSLTEGKNLGEGTIITGWIDSKAFVVLHFGKDGVSSKIHGWGKDPVVLAAASRLDDFEARRYFDYDAASHSIVYIAKTEKGTKLVHAVLKDGKVTNRTTIGEGRLIGLPYFVRG